MLSIQVPLSSTVCGLVNSFGFYLTPPSGISIFFCPETKSSNANETEKERLLALADKVNISDIEKLSKQKLYIPNTLMDLCLDDPELLHNDKTLFRRMQSFHPISKRVGRPHVCKLNYVLHYPSI